MTKKLFIRNKSELNTSETETGTVAVPHFLKLQSFSTKKDFWYLPRKVRNFLNYKISTLGISIQHYEITAKMLHFQMSKNRKSLF